MCLCAGRTVLPSKRKLRRDLLIERVGSCSSDHSWMWFGGQIQQGFRFVLERPTLVLCAERADRDRGPGRVGAPSRLGDHEGGRGGAPQGLPLLRDGLAPSERRGRRHTQRDDGAGAAAAHADARAASAHHAMFLQTNAVCFK